MSIRAEAVTARIRSAMLSSNPDDIVSGVKDAVAEEVSSLSPDAKINVTRYFNHSYMPDLVLEWTDAGKQDYRPIFLRNTFTESLVEEEVHALAPRGPVMLALTDTATHIPRMDSLRERAREANRMLLTDVGSLADIASPANLEARTARNQRAEAAPLLRLVQANILKGGRGLITSDDARRLTSSAAPDDTQGINEEFLSSFQDSADESFAPDAALRLKRAAELLWLGLSPDFVEDLPSAHGQLSDVELRVLLPYLLSNDRARVNPRLWAYLGSMMSLERLEQMSEVLRDIDVSVLVVPNASSWTARGAQLVLNSGYTEDDDVGYAIGPSVPTRTLRGIRTSDTTVDTADAPGWFLRNRMLTAVAGQWRLFVTTDRRRLKGRGGSAAAHWEDIAAMLTNFTLDAVDLRGLARRIAVSAEESGDVSADVALIRRNIPDSFQVTEISIRPTGPEAVPGIKVDFGEMTVTADHAPIAALVKAAALLGHRSPPDFTGLLNMGH